MRFVVRRADRVGTELRRGPRYHRGSANSDQLPAKKTHNIVPTITRPSDCFSLVNRDQLHAASGILPGPACLTDGLFGIER